MSLKVLKSVFLYSVPSLKLMRPHDVEIAMVGRSNAGKSSLINAICNKRDLARTSKTPGRTRHAVVYDVVYELKETKNFTLVDLPGFGFASMSKAEAEEAESLLFDYIKKRTWVKLIVLLIDIRRSLDEREKFIISTCKARNIDFLLVLTKCDKIALSKRKPIINKMAQDMAIDKTRIILHTTFDEMYANELQKIIFDKL